MPSASARRSAAARFSTGFTTTFPEAFYFTSGIDEIRACSACLSPRPALAPERALLALPPRVRMEHSRLDRPQSSAASRNSRTFAARSRVVPVPVELRLPGLREYVEDVWKPRAVVARLGASRGLREPARPPGKARRFWRESHPKPLRDSFRSGGAPSAASMARNARTARPGGRAARLA